jgi:hypothetical protein
MKKNNRSIQSTVYPIDYNRNTPDYNSWVRSMQPAYDRNNGTRVTEKIIQIELTK